MDAIFLAALAALIWGTAAFFEKLGVTGGDPAAGVLVRTVGVVGAALAYAALAPGAAKEAWRMPWRAAACFAVGGALASVLGQIFFYQALRKSDIGRVAAVGGAWPAVAFLLGVLFLHEPLDGRRAAGVALVMAGVALLR